MTQENVNGYDLKKAVAVHEQDVDVLRNMYATGESLQQKYAIALENPLSTRRADEEPHKSSNFLPKKLASH